MSIADKSTREVTKSSSARLYQIASASGISSPFCQANNGSSGVVLTAGVCEEVGCGSGGGGVRPRACR